MAAILEAIAEARRREILRLVWERELPVSEIASGFSVSQAAISQHLRVLREAGLVSVRAEGRHRYYQAVPEALGDLRGYLESYWRDALERLKTLAELEARQRGPRGR